MKGKRNKQIPEIFVVIAAVVCLAAAIGLSGLLERQKEAARQKVETEDLLLQGKKLKGFVFGSEGLIADWYWMSSLQYIGEKLFNSKQKNINIDDLRPLDPKLLYPLLDNATTLDPQFMAAYSYGATVLPAIDKKQAIAIAKKGISNNPDAWNLYHQLGYIYWKLQDFKSAAEIYGKGSEVKDAPDWMKSMSARMDADGGSPETAREIYSQLIQNAGDDMTRESARLHIARLDSLEERKLLDETLQEFRGANGRCAESWAQIISMLMKKKLPGGREFRIDTQNNIVDPTDAPYLIDRAACAVKVDTNKSKLPPNE